MSSVPRWHRHCRVFWDSEPKMMSRVFNSLPEGYTAHLHCLRQGQEEPDANLQHLAYQETV